MVARLRAEGPLTANELGGAKKGGTWWDWSETKIAAEWLLDIGELVCRRRRGFQRVYDLAERAIPTDLLDQEWSDEECTAHLVAAAARSLGVATVADLAAYHGMLQAQVRDALGVRRARRVRVEGWKAPAYADPEALERLEPPRRHTERPALAVRLVDLVPRPCRAPVRAAPPSRGVYPEGAAQVRLLRHAGAGAARRSSVWWTQAATGRGARGEAGDFRCGWAVSRARGTCALGGGVVGRLVRVALQHVEPASAQAPMREPRETK